MVFKMFSLNRRFFNAIKMRILSTYSLEIRILLRVIACIFIIVSVKLVTHYRIIYRKYNYPHLPAEALETELYKQTSPNLVLYKSKPVCKYDEILTSTSSLLNSEVPTNFDDFSEKGFTNGGYAPKHCNPLFSVAVIVIYRNRQRQLDTFVPFMHNFLRKQNIHYRIYLVEQLDLEAFNRGMLLNIGAKIAIEDKFPCLILHDVDLLPLDASNLYACTNDVRHMSASIDKFGFVLPYHSITGGVLAVKSEDFVAVNGFSNRFEGWGGEDDDFYFRLKMHRFKVVRFPRQMSRYTMMEHPQEHRNSARRHILRENRQNGAGANDGLSTLPHISMRVTHSVLLTHIGVKL